MIKRTAKEWADRVGVEIIDADGWNSITTLDTPIHYYEFCNRMNESTIRPLRKGAPQPLTSSQIYEFGQGGMLDI